MILATEELLALSKTDGARLSGAAPASPRAPAERKAPPSEEQALMGELIKTQQRLATILEQLTRQGKTPVAVNVAPPRVEVTAPNVTVQSPERAAQSFRLTHTLNQNGDIVSTDVHPL